MKRKKEKQPPCHKKRTKKISFKQIVVRNNKKIFRDKLVLIEQNKRIAGEITVQLKKQKQTAKHCWKRIILKLCKLKLRINSYKYNSLNILFTMSLIRSQLCKPPRCMICQPCNTWRQLCSARCTALILSPALLHWIGDNACQAIYLLYHNSPICCIIDFTFIANALVSSKKVSQVKFILVFELIYIKLSLPNFVIPQNAIDLKRYCWSQL